MATVRWVGRAQAVAQVTTITIGGTWLATETLTLTINDKSLVVTIGSLVTTAQVATTLKQSWENETLTDTTASFTPANGGQDIVEHAEITATVNGSVVTLTHDTPGVPFTITASETSAAGTVTPATATAATGPNFWDNTDNWDTGTVPVATDDIYIDNSDVAILYALDQPTGTATSLNIGANYTGTIGLPKQNPAGYVEYRAEYLEQDATTVIIGRGEGAGSGRLKLNMSSVQTSVFVESTGTPLENGLAAVLLLGTHAGNTLEVLDGSVAVAAFGGETSTLDICRVTDGDLYLGAGVTLAGGANDILSNQSGSVEFFSNADNVTNEGTMIVSGSATVTTLTLKGGRVNYNSSGTITTATIGGAAGGTLDFSGRNTPRTITTTTIKEGGTIIDPLQTVTYTNAIALGSDVRQVSAS